MKNKSRLSIYGYGLYENLDIKKSNVILNIITPYMPITSDGKQPDMTKFSTQIVQAINKASGEGKYRFSQRQLHYAIRPYLINELGKELEYGYFCGVIIRPL